MTLYQFNALDKLQQANAVFEHGVYLTDLINKHYKLLLFQIDAFYVEAWYDFKVKKVMKYRSFKGTEHLTPYLNQIIFDDLKQL
jgi:hypothetical protein